MQNIKTGEPKNTYKEIGYWFKKNTKENVSLAMVEIGIIGWYSDRKIIDILGLVNPKNAKFIGERKFNKWLSIYNPDYILIHDPIWVHEKSAKKALASGMYIFDNRFNSNFAGYKLLKKKHLERER